MKWFTFLAIVAVVISVASVIGTIALGQPLDKITPLEDLAIVPTRMPPPVAFDGNSGSYTRTIVAPPGTLYDAFAPSKTPFAGVQPFQGRDSASPSFESDSYSIGQGQGGRITGGSVAEWKDVVRKGPIVLIIFGGLAVVGGIVLAIWAGQLMLGLAIAGAGLVLIVTGVMFESYPWIAIVAFVLIVGVGVWWVLSSRSLTTAKVNLTATVDKVGHALKAVVQGVGAAPEDAKAAVKASIGKAASATGDAAGVETTITAVKNGVNPTEI